MIADIQIPEECPVWLAMWISKSDERLSNIEESLVHLVKRRAPKNNPGGKNSDKVTFKWLVEKLAVPAMFMLAGYLVAHG